MQKRVCSANSKSKNIHGRIFLDVPTVLFSRSPCICTVYFKRLTESLCSTVTASYFISRVMSVLRRHNSRCRFASIRSLGKCSRIQVRLIGLRVFCSVRYMNNFFVPIEAVTKRHHQRRLLLLPTDSGFQLFQGTERKYHRVL